MNLLLIRKINVIVFTLITIILIAFDVYKASHTSFTHDESFTYLSYVNDSIMAIISYKNPFPNNHILNSLLMKFSQAIFGSSELALRLPNIVAHLLYLIFSFKIFKRYNERNAIWFFILINANPFLLDFFSLARGYGIAIGLMVTAFYFYCRFIECQKNKYHFLALLLLCFAALANFALINLILVFILVHNLMQFFVSYQKISFKNVWRTNYINILLLLLLAAVCYLPIHKVTTLNMLNFGGMDGFWEDTVRSLLNASSYYANYGALFMIIGKTIIIIFSTLFFLRCTFYVIKKNSINLTQKIMLCFGSILFLIALSSIMQNQWFNTPLLVSRFALFLYPIFILMSSFILIDLLAYSYPYISRIFLYILSGFFLLHTCYTINVKWYCEWYYDMDSKHVTELLSQIKNQEPVNKISLGSTWIFAPALHFYKQTGNLNWLNLTSNKDAKQINDYDYFTEEEYNKMPLKGMEVVHYYSSSNNFLVRYVPYEFLQLKASNNKYICSDGTHNNLLAATSDNGWKWETFTLLRLKNNKVAIASYESKFLSARNKEEMVSATKKETDKEATFIMINLENDSVAFKTYNGKYLTLNNQSNQIFANANSIGKNEKFKFIPIK